MKGKLPPLRLLSCTAPRSRQAPGLGPVVPWGVGIKSREQPMVSVLPHPDQSHLQGHQPQQRKVQKSSPAQSDSSSVRIRAPHCFSSPTHFPNPCSLALTPSSGCSLCWEEQPATNSWLQLLPVKTSPTVQAVCEVYFLCGGSMPLCPHGTRCRQLPSPIPYRHFTDLG